MEVTVAVAQYPITKHTNWESYRKHITQWVDEACSKGGQIVVFPEYGSMELTSLLSTQEQADLQLQIAAMQQFIPDFIELFQNLAATRNCIIVSPSVPFRTEACFVNRCFVFSPTSYSWQDKHFMTRFENESWGISTSDGKLRLFDTAYGKLGIQICYDIEFPIGSHLLAQAGADLILVPSCTETLKGATRVHIGARARAMEQQIYTAVAQTVEESLWSPAVDINYGYTACYASPDGHFQDEGILALTPAQQPGWLIHTLNYAENKQIRIEGQVFNFKDSSRLTIQCDDLQVETVKMY